jgi:HPt (histidine-containing phosphotransfer) domain-containing protein
LLDEPIALDVSNHVLDFAAMRRMVGDDDELIADLVELFLADYPARLEDLKSAFAAGNHEAVRRVAHTLKGGASNLCALRVTESARALEAAIRTGDVEHLSARVDQLVGAVEELASVLRGLQAERVADQTPGA